MSPADSPPPPALKEHAAVLFSGGTDSTLAAALSLAEVRRVTLLTFQPGFVLFIENTRVHARKLEEKYGSDRVQHLIIDIGPFIRSVLGSDLRADLGEYGFNLTSLVCLENGVPYLVDGSIRAQSSIPEQMETVIRRNRRFYSQEYGIHHFSPIYEEAESDRRLEELGIADKKRLKKQFILYDTQGTCVFGVPADVYGKLFYGALVGGQREQDSEEYCAEKYPLMRKTIARTLADRGMDVADRVRALKEIRRRDGDLGPSQHEDGAPAFDRARDAAGVQGR
jgi:hypothetical protein